MSERYLLTTEGRLTLRPGAEREQLPGEGTRLDPRYVSSTDPRACLRAWGGEDDQSMTLDMGGWTDLDEAAFLAAVQDESRHVAGEELKRVAIEPVEHV